MATKSFLFDNGFQQPVNQTLTWNFDRPWATVTPGGAISPASQGAVSARYWHHQRLLCGSPVVTRQTQLEDGSFNFVASGGVGLDSSTPMMAYFAADPSKIKIFLGSLATTIHDKTLIELSTLQPKKKGELDLLVGESYPSEPDTGESADHVYHTHSFRVAHGLVFATCQVKRLLADSVCNLVGVSDPMQTPDGQVYEVTVDHVSGPLPKWDTSARLYMAGLEGATLDFAISKVQLQSGSRYVVTVSYGQSFPGYVLPPVTCAIVNWEPFATALCYWQPGQAPSGLGTTRGWKLHATSAETQPGRDRGAGFQCQGFRLLNDGPVTRIWIPFSN